MTSNYYLRVRPGTQPGLVDVALTLRTGAGSFAELLAGVMRRDALDELCAAFGCPAEWVCGATPEELFGEDRPDWPAG